MKFTAKNRIRDKMEAQMNRPMKENELVNMETDALALAQYLMEKVDDLEDRINLLEKR